MLYDYIYRWSCSVSFLFYDKSELNPVKSVAVLEVVIQKLLHKSKVEGGGLLVFVANNEYHLLKTEITLEDWRENMMLTYHCPSNLP